jgi:hypothetical protein
VGPGTHAVGAGAHDSTIPLAETLPSPERDASRVAVRCAILFAARPQVRDARGRTAILSCCGKDLRESWDRFTVFYPIRQDT